MPPAMPQLDSKLNTFFKHSKYSGWMSFKPSLTGTLTKTPFPLATFFWILSKKMFPSLQTTTRKSTTGFKDLLSLWSTLQIA